MELDGLDESDRASLPVRSDVVEQQDLAPQYGDEGEEPDAALEQQPGAGADDTDNFVCSVCQDDEAEDDNPIIMCDGGCGKGAWQAVP
jgi:hypothetical protein